MSARDQFVLQMGGGLTWLAKRNQLIANEVMTLSALILVDGPDGCHPTQDTIADVSGLGRGVVRRSLESLNEKSLVSVEERRYWDSRKRERRKRCYVFSEEIEIALEFATETIELKRRSTQPSLLSDFPFRATDDQRGIPYSRDSRAEKDQDSPFSEQLPGVPTFPVRAPVDQTGIPHSRDSRAEKVPFRATVDPYRGGGGKKDQYMTVIRSYTPTPPPTPEERELSMQMMMHSAIGMPRDFAQAIAARWSPREVLERCRAYSADYNAEGGAKGVGALIYRFANPDSYPNREIRSEDSYDYEWYSEFEYLVGLQEGLYEPCTEEEEIEPVLEIGPNDEESRPRPALVPAGAMAEPGTAEAVFNTLEMPQPQFESDRKAWQRVVSEMELTMPAAAYHTWLHGQTEYVESTDDRFMIRVSSAYVRDWLRSRARKKMEAALKDLTGRSVEIEFMTDTQIVEETNGNGRPGLGITAYAGTAKREGQRGP